MLLHFGAGNDEHVSEKDAWLNSAVWMCIDTIATAFPEAKPQVIDSAQDEPLEEHALVDLLVKPNPYMGMHQLFYQLMVDMHIAGTGYWYKGRDKSSGEVVSLWPLIPQFVTPKKKDDIFIDHYEYGGYGEANPRVFPATDVVRFPLGADPDNPRVGLSPLVHVLHEIADDREATKFQAALFKNHAIPGMMITAEDIDASDDELDAFQTQWIERYGGKNRGKPAILAGRDIQMHQIGFNPEQLSLNDAHTLPEERIAGVFGVPPIVAGLGAGLQRSTYSNFREAKEMFTERKMVSMWRLVEDQINLQLLRDFASENMRFAFDLSEVRAFQEDENQKWARAKDAATNGLITINEFRAEIGKPPIEGGDVYRVPIGLVTEMPTPEAGANVTEVTPPLLEAGTEKGREIQITRALQILQARQLPKATRIIGKAFDELAAEVDSQIKDNFAVDVLRLALDGGKIRDAVTQVYIGQGELSFKLLNGIFGVSVDWNPSNPFIRSMIDAASTRGDMVADTTIKAVRKVIADGGTRAEIRAAIKETYAGRAETIARTELRKATNESSIARYREAGIDYVDVIDGDQDEPCALRNGRRVTLTEFIEMESSEHPNGTLTCIPVVEG